MTNIDFQEKRNFGRNLRPAYTDCTYPGRKHRQQFKRSGHEKENINGYISTESASSLKCGEVPSLIFFQERMDVYILLHGVCFNLLSPSMYPHVLRSPFCDAYGRFMSRE